MQMKTYLSEYTRKELLDEARSLELKKCSTLRKADLIDRIVDCFCSEEFLRSRLSCLTQEEICLFRKACVSPQEIPMHDVMPAMQMCRYLLGGFDEITDRFSVFTEIAEVFSSIDDEAFRTDQKKKGWMMKCINFAVNYYGIVPLEILYKLYSLKIRSSLEEMTAMLWNMPTDIVESCIFPLSAFGMQNWSKNHPLYSETGLLIHISILQNQEMQYLLDHQMDKAFYIPSARQIEEIQRIGYEADSPSYKKLETFFIRKLHLSYEQAVSWCLQVWANSYEGEQIGEIFQKLNDAGIAFMGEKQLNEFAKLLMDAHNHTRLRENRGHTPIELAGKEAPHGMPTIVPGSSKAAEMLRESLPELQRMGIPVDLDSNADTIQTVMYPEGIAGQAVRTEKKIYPNDPCPCGSGKKYKKCCGKH